MAELLEFKVDSASLFDALRKTAPEIAKALRSELVAGGRQIILEARTKMPSGMRAGQYGYTQKFWGTKGVILEAQGNADVSAPKSYAGALEDKRGWRHPVWDSRKPAKRWGPKGGYQHATPQPLRSTFDEKKTWLVLKSEEAADRALKQAGWQGEE